MREILFRGKRVDNGEWVEGYYFKATHHWHNHGMHEDWIAVDTIQNGGYCNVRGKYAIIPETLGQFTGLTDKNGKRIFEGDIVQSIELELKGVIIFDEYCRFMIKDITTNSTYLTARNNEDIVVIGNIHDKIGDNL